MDSTNRKIIFDSYFTLGEICALESKEKESMSFYYEALKLNPDHSETYFRMGELFRHKKMYLKALKLLTRALEVFQIGDNSHILRSLA